MVDHDFDPDDFVPCGGDKDVDDPDHLAAQAEPPPLDPELEAEIAHPDYQEE